MMGRNTADFTTLLKCNKPTIAKVRGYCVAGGSDIALCCDIIIMSETARIGYPPARIWGVPSTGMWCHRIGAQAAKRMLFTGDLVDGKEAKELGICLKCVADDKLDEEVDKLAKRMEGVPRNQLMMTKMVINSALDNQGLATSQMLSVFFDGVARHSPEGLYFKEKAEKEGFHEAVKERDSGAHIAKGVSKL